MALGGGCGVSSLEMDTATRVQTLFAFHIATQPATFHYCGKYDIVVCKDTSCIGIGLLYVGGRPTFARVCEEVHRSMYLKSLSELLLAQSAGAVVVEYTDCTSAEG